MSRFLGNTALFVAFVVISLSVVAFHKGFATFDWITLLARDLVLTAQIAAAIIAAATLATWVQVRAESDP